MLLKRIICVITVLSLLLSFGTVYAEDDNTAIEILETDTDETAAEGTVGTEITLAADMAMGIGAFDEYVPNKKVTLGEFAVVISKLAASEHIANKYIAESQYQNGVKIITAYAVMLDILGYSIYFKDGSIDSHDTTEILYIADKYDISDGVTGSPDDIITYQQLAEMIYNTMQAHSIDTVYHANGENTYYTSTIPYMEKALDMYIAEGVVQRTSFSSIVDTENSKEPNVIISGNKYNCEMGKYEEFIGRKVKALYRFKRNTRELLAMHDVSDRVLEINAKDLDVDNITMRKVNYWADGNKVRTAKISDAAYILYNNCLLKNATAEDLKIDQGILVLIDNNSDSQYDVVKIEVYQSVQIFAVSTEAKTITVSDSSMSTLSIDDMVEYGYPVYDHGRIIKPENITLNSIATCYKGLDGEVIKLYICTDTIAGTVNYIDADNNIVVLEGKEVFYTNEIATDIEALELGTTIIAYLNHMGEISAFEIGKDKYLYGYLSNFIERRGLNNPQLKIFTQMIEFKIYDTASKIKVNGVSMSSADAFANVAGSVFWDNDNKQAMLIKYSTNSKGVINAIYTPTGSLEEKAMCPARPYLNQLGNYRYSSSLKTLAPDSRLDERTKVFIIPYDRDDIRDYNYGTHNVFLEKDYNCQIYDIDDNYYIGSVIATPDPDYIEGPAEPAIVPAIITSVRHTLNDLGEDTIKIIARTLGTTTTTDYTFKELSMGSTLGSNNISVNDLEPGDVVQLFVDTNHTIEVWLFKAKYKMTKHGSDGSLKFYTEPYEEIKPWSTWDFIHDANHFPSGNGFNTGTVLEVVKNGFVANFKPQNSDGSYQTSWNRLLATSTATRVSICETRSNGDVKIYDATVGDIQEGDRIFVSRDNIVNEVVIYRGEDNR